MSESALPLGDVLSVTTGTLVSRDHIQGVYRVCDHMTGTSNFTHQLPRVLKEIAPVILDQHPDLADVVMPDWDDDLTKETVLEWLTEQELIYGITVDLVPLASYTGPDPIEELYAMAGSKPVVAVVAREAS